MNSDKLILSARLAAQALSLTNELLEAEHYNAAHITCKQALADMAKVLSTLENTPEQPNAVSDNKASGS